jgi:hypothetical protein
LDLASTFLVDALLATPLLDVVLALAKAEPVPRAKTPSNKLVIKSLVPNIQNLDGPKLRAVWRHFTTK